MKYILFNKPYGVLSQFKSESGHPGLMGYQFPADVYPAGRLDHDSEGALLLTDDGPFIKKLLDPKFAHSRTYLVQVDGDITSQAIDELQKGVDIQGYHTKRCFVEKVENPDIPDRDPPIRYRKNIPTSWIKITLTEGKNRQVRHMTAKVGFPTLRLLRIKIGKLDLGTLPVGQWKEVSKKDIL